ncbi:hypothetical protein [Ensifer adhaerens]|uniref:hypothetical protein n=1 Tax=Ensifer adhaerens TaxID=106592 RepID=UPI003F8271AE
MADFILIDTSVLSEARRVTPDDDVIFFLRQIPPGAIAVPPAAIFELERGALNLAKTDPVRAEKFSKWLDGLLQTDVWLPPIDPHVKRLTARMAMTPELRRFWISNGTPPKMRFGCDPEIAAISIVHELPLASLDVSDFLLIDRHFPLPGLYSPKDGIWHVAPPEGWRIAECLGAGEDEWSAMIGSVG